MDSLCESKYRCILTKCKQPCNFKSKKLVYGDWGSSGGGVDKEKKIEVLNYNTVDKYILIEKELAPRYLNIVSYNNGLYKKHVLDGNYEVDVKELDNNNQLNPDVKIVNDSDEEDEIKY